METEHTQSNSAPSGAKKMGKFRASYLLAIEALELLRKDKQVLLFPLFSGIASLVLLLAFGIFSFIFGEAIRDVGHFSRGGGYGAMLLLYLFLAFIAAFFRAGLTAVVDKRINGGNMSFREGMRAAFARTEKIFLWAVLSATIGVLLLIISRFSRWLGGLISFIFGAAWGIITFFIVPALILEEGDVISAVKSSAVTFKKTWGETLILNISAGLFFGAAAFAGTVVIAILAVLGIAFLPVAVSVPLFFLFLTLLLIFLVGAALLCSAVNTIFRVVLYEYAKTGRIMDEFSPELVLGALKKQKGND